MKKDEYYYKNEVYESESIIRFWKIAYIYLFDDFLDYITFQDKKGVWECSKIFWKIYWCNKISNNKIY